MNKTIKNFSRYIMHYNENKITNLVDGDGKETLFTHTFYNLNNEFLDEFENILDFVKPKRESMKKTTITIDLEDLEVRYNNLEELEKNEALQIALKVIRLAMSEENEEVKELKEELIKNENDLKTLLELEEDGLIFEEEKEEINKTIEEIKEKINTIINA